MTDLRQAADILRGRQVHPDVRVIIVPASRKIWREAMREGLLDVFAEAGAMVSTPTCGACFGGGMGILAPGETAVATTNRNFRGRMGGKGSKVYLANAHVAAAAAVAGELVDPAAVIGCGAGVIVEGAAVVIAEDNVDTDVLYPGPFLNIEDPEQMKRAPLRGPRPVAARPARRRHGAGGGRELRLGLVSRARPAGHARVGHPLRRGPLVRAHLPPQLHQPGAARAAGAGRRGEARRRRSGSTPRRAPSASASATTPARPVPQFMLDTVLAGGLVQWGRQRAGPPEG